MALDFLSCERKIELNQKTLETYNEGLEKAAGRISLISIIYSVLSIYLAQLIRFTIVHQFENIVFIIFLALLVLCMVISILWTIKFLLPVKILHVHAPRYFYSDIRKQYEEQGVEADKLNGKIGATYLFELEKAVDNNYKAYKAKRRYFQSAFNFALIALIPYLICASIMMATKEKEEPQKIEITNSQKLATELDSLLSKHK